MEVRNAGEIAAAFAALEGRADALFVVPEQLFNTNRLRVNELAMKARLPTMHGFREPVEAGALMSYGPDYLDMFRRRICRSHPARRQTGRHSGRAADQVPAPINLEVAKALGIALPPSVLARADEVIE